MLSLLHWWVTASLWLYYHYNWKLLRTILKYFCSHVIKAKSFLPSSFLSLSLSLFLSLQVSRISRVDSGSFRPTQWVINANGNTLTNQGLQIGTVCTCACVCVCVCPSKYDSWTSNIQNVMLCVCACINCMMNTVKKYDCHPFIKYIFLDYHTHWTLFWLFTLQQSGIWSNWISRFIEST